MLIKKTKLTDLLAVDPFAPPPPPLLLTIGIEEEAEEEEREGK